MKYVINFYTGLIEDLKAFVFWILLLCLFRAIFLIIFAGQLATSSYGDITACLWLGARLSMKTSGWICALGFILTTLPAIFNQSILKWKLRFHAFFILIFCIMFMARFPYYRLFNAAFDGMIVTGLFEDWWAMIVTVITEYGIWWRLPLALVLTDIFYYMLKIFLWYAPLANFAQCQRKWPVIALSIVGLPLLCVFVRWGGAFNYQHGISWLSAARFNSQLLNEATLDDGQALTRVWAIWSVREQIDNIDLDENTIKHYIKRLEGNPNAADIDLAFQRKVQKQILKEQPQNIVLVLNEGFGSWPLQEGFKQMNLLPRTKEILSKENSCAIETMLPAGPATIFAVQSVFTGTPFTGSRYNFENRHDQHNDMLLSSIMHDLGYKTVFWYSGFRGWENIGQFASSVGFDEFYHCGDFDYKEGNSWGAADKDFYDFFLSKIKSQGDAKVLHVLLPGSNHPPFSVDIEKAGFKKKNLQKLLPPAIDDSRYNLKALGHFWYADKCMGDMIDCVEKALPDTLFILTADHPGRFNFAEEQSNYVRATIPFILYGKGITKNLFPQDSVGCHQQIPATLAELLGPPGFTYSSLMPSMLQNHFVFNHNFWARDNWLGQNRNLPRRDRNYITAQRELSAQRILNGNQIKH